VTVKVKIHYAIVVAERSEAGRRPAASWNLAYQTHIDTHRETQTYSSQYCCTPYWGKVMKTQVTDK